MYLSCEYTLAAQLPLLFSLALLLPIIQQLSLNIMSSTCTDAMYFYIVDFLYSLFLSLLLRVPRSSSTITNMFYI
jgi:hypothetical protein